MIVLLILAAVTLLAPLLGFGPYVQRDATQSQNNLLFVRMRPPEWYLARNQTYRGVVARTLTSAGGYIVLERAPGGRFVEVAFVA